MLLKAENTKQTYGMLNRNDKSYCCLGVLCEVAIKNGVSIIKNKHEYITYDEESNIPPIKVMNWLGVIEDKKRPMIDNRNFVWKDFIINRLAYLNDEKHKSFEEIADYIEDAVKNGKPKRYLLLL